VLILAIYISILFLGLLSAISQRHMLLLRGRGIFALTLVSGIIALVLLLIRDRAASAWSIAIWPALLAAATLARSRWFFLWFDPAGFAADVETSLRMLLIPFVKTERGYTLQLRDGDVFLQLRTGPGRIATMWFRQERKHKKADLLRSLLRKKFDPLFPRLKIHIR
jgi:hypothetical protein